MSDFGWGSFLGPALSATVSTIGGLFAADAAADNQKDAADRDLQAQKDLLLFKKELAEGAGGGGGGGGPFTGFTGPQLVSMKQGQGKQTQDAISQMVAAYQAALLSK